MKIDLERFAKATDMKGEVLRAMSKLLDDPKFQVTRNLVLVAPYIAPEKTAGGIYRPPSVIAEDRWQSKCGFVLAMGPIAFKFPEGDSDPASIVKPDVGDWVLYRTADTFEVGMGEGAIVRFVEDGLIYSVVGDPTKVY